MQIMMAIEDYAAVTAQCDKSREETGTHVLAGFEVWPKQHLPKGCYLIRRGYGDEWTPAKWSDPHFLPNWVRAQTTELDAISELLGDQLNREERNSCLGPLFRFVT